jgi:hypothetical protein
MTLAHSCDGSHKYGIKTVHTSMRTCKRCGETKADGDFYASYPTCCKECKKKAQSERYAPRKQATKSGRLSAYSGDGRKRCNTCGEYKSVEDYSPHPTHWDRLSHDCKACKSERGKRNYQQNKQARLAANRKWYQENRAKRGAKIVEWRRRNRDAAHAIWHRYRARKLDAGGSFTAKEWRALVAFYAPDGRCLGCGAVAPLTKDHVIPLYQGGNNDIGNIQPICRPCNSAKGDERVIDYRPDGGEYARSI